MLKAVRYTLAAICLTASVGCLALWWRSLTRADVLLLGEISQRVPYAVSLAGRIELATAEYIGGSATWTSKSMSVAEGRDREFALVPASAAFFGRRLQGFYLPHWYAALVFVVVAFIAIRIVRFTLRSMLIAMSVVAALLGMVVAL
jgi:hypothetical protein